MWEIIRADLMHVSTGFLNPTKPNQHIETSAVSVFSVNLLYRFFRQYSDVSGGGRAAKGLA